MTTKTAAFVGTGARPARGATSAPGAARVKSRRAGANRRAHRRRPSAAARAVPKTRQRGTGAGAPPPPSVEAMAWSRPCSPSVPCAISHLKGRWQSAWRPAAPTRQTDKWQVARRAAGGPVSVRQRARTVALRGTLPGQRPAWGRAPQWPRSLAPRQAKRRRRRHHRHGQRRTRAA